MKYPLRYAVYEIVKEEGPLTDDEILSILNKNGNKCSSDELNKVLMQLEILGLVTVRWVGKDKRRIEQYTQPQSDTLNQ
jgi:Fe2+ or Zn2+ uptake regulation protein